MTPAVLERVAGILVGREAHSGTWESKNQPWHQALVQSEWAFCPQSVAHAVQGARKFFELVVLLKLALEREVGECNQRALLNETGNTNEGNAERRE